MRLALSKLSQDVQSPFHTLSFQYGNQHTFWEIPTRKVCSPWRQLEMWDSLSNFSSWQKRLHPVLFVFLFWPFVVVCLVLSVLLCWCVFGAVPVVSQLRWLRIAECCPIITHTPATVTSSLPSRIFWRLACPWIRLLVCLSWLDSPGRPWAAKSAHMDREFLFRSRWYRTETKTLGKHLNSSCEKAPCTDLRSDLTLQQNSYRTTQADAYVNHAHQTQAQSVNSQT